MSDSFSNAVSWAAHASAPIARKGVDAFEDYEPMEIILRLRLGIYCIPDDPTDAQAETSGKMFCSDEAACWLYGQIYRSTAAFKLLCDVSSNFIMRGLVLRDPLRGFAAMRITGYIRPPKPSNPKAMKTAGRNLFFLAWLHVIHTDFGLDFTRGDAAKIHESACDALSKGLEMNGYHVSFRALKELCVGKSHQTSRETAHELAAAWAIAKKAGIIPPETLERSFYGI